jgi:plasmid stabilization system protein ParE
MCSVSIAFWRLKTLIEAAKRAVKVIRLGVRVLEQQPGMGRPVQDMDDEFRDWIIDFGDTGYVARYRVVQEVVIILAVRHQKEAGF